MIFRADSAAENTYNMPEVTETARAVLESILDSTLVYATS